MLRTTRLSRPNGFVLDFGSLNEKTTSTVFSTQGYLSLVTFTPDSVSPCATNGSSFRYRFFFLTGQPASTARPAPTADYQENLGEGLAAAGQSTSPQGDTIDTVLFSGGNSSGSAQQDPNSGQRQDDRAELEGTAVSACSAGLAAAALFAGTAAFALAGDVVVLKGGTVISLKQPMVRRGNTVYLTRTDGTLLSVPASEIDRDATAAARPGRAGARPGGRAGGVHPRRRGRAPTKDGPKARVRITDADVSHPMERHDAGRRARTRTRRTRRPAARRSRSSTTSRRRRHTGLQIHGSLRNPGPAAPPRTSGSP